MEQLIIGVILLMIGLHLRTEHRLTVIEQKINKTNGNKNNG